MRCFGCYALLTVILFVLGASCRSINRVKREDAVADTPTAVPSTDEDNGNVISSVDALSLSDNLTTTPSTPELPITASKNSYSPTLINALSTPDTKPPTTASNSADDTTTVSSTPLPTSTTITTTFTDELTTRNDDSIVKTTLDFDSHTTLKVTTELRDASTTKTTIAGILEDTTGNHVSLSSARNVAELEYASAYPNVTAAAVQSNMAGEITTPYPPMHVTIATSVDASAVQPSLHTSFFTQSIIASMSYSGDDNIDEVISPTSALPGIEPTRMETMPSSSILSSAYPSPDDYHTSSMIIPSASLVSELQTVTETSSDDQNKITGGNDSYVEDSFTQLPAIDTTENLISAFTQAENSSIEVFEGETNVSMQPSSSLDEDPSTFDSFTPFFNMNSNVVTSSDDALYISPSFSSIDVSMSVSSDAVMLMSSTVAQTEHFTTTASSVTPSNSAGVPETDYDLSTESINNVSSFDPGGTTSPPVYDKTTSIVNTDDLTIPDFTDKMHVNNATLTAAYTNQPVSAPEQNTTEVAFVDITTDSSHDYPSIPITTNIPTEVTSSSKSFTKLDDNATSGMLDTFSVPDSTTSLSTTVDFSSTVDSSSILDSASTVHNLTDVDSQSTVDSLSTIDPASTNSSNGLETLTSLGMTTVSDGLISYTTDSILNPTTQADPGMSTADADATTADYTTTPPFEKDKTTSTLTTTSESQLTTMDGEMTTASSLPVVIPTLNTSDAYQTYWVKTVILVDLSVPTTTDDFIQSMEEKLVALYDKSIIEQQPLTAGNRRRRSASRNNVTVQMISADRPVPEAEDTELVHYLSNDGEIVPAEQTVSLMNYFHVQEVALILGYPVVTVAEVYAPPPPPKDSKLWIIGVVVAGIIVLVGFIWCILFIYFKCTRGPKHQTPRGRGSKARLSKNMDQSLTNFRLSKQDVRGFDIVRTEVGLQRDLGREKKFVEGSSFKEGSDYEGMYSGPDSPSSSQPLQPYRANESLGSRSSGRGGHPSSVSRGGGRGGMILSRRSTTESTDEADDDETTESERLPLSTPFTSGPRSNGKGKKSKARQKGRKKKETDSEEETYPVHGSGGRSTTHALRLPPVTQQPLVAKQRSTKRDEYMRESLQHKADLERQRNKQRQRDKKKDKKKSKKEEKEAEEAFKKVQQEIGEVLGDQLPNIFIQQPKKGKSKRSSRTGSHLADDDTTTDSMEMHDFIQPLSGQHVRRTEELGQVETDSESESELRGSDSGLSETPQLQKQVAFEEARQRMHALLDDAFALLAPAGNSEKSSGHRKSKNKVGPSHIPVVLPSHGKALHSSSVVWNPYSAGDEANQIIQAERPQTLGDLPPGVVDASPEMENRTSGTKSLSQHETSTYQYTNPAYNRSHSNADQQSRNQVITEKFNPLNDTSQRYPSNNGDTYTSMHFHAGMISPSMAMTNKINRDSSPPTRDTSSKPLKENCFPVTQVPTLVQQPGNESKIIMGYATPFQQSASHTEIMKKDNLKPRAKQHVQHLDDYYNEDDTKEDLENANQVVHKIVKGSFIEDGDDELDVIEKTIKTGSTQTSVPLVDSIRAELQRIAVRGNITDRSERIN